MPKNRPVCVTRRKQDLILHTLEAANVPKSNICCLGPLTFWIRMGLMTTLPIPDPPMACQHEAFSLPVTGEVSMQVRNQTSSQGLLVTVRRLTVLPK